MPKERNGNRFGNLRREEREMVEALGEAISYDESLDFLPENVVEILKKTLRRYFSKKIKDRGFVRNIRIQDLERGSKEERRARIQRRNNLTP